MLKQSAISKLNEAQQALSPLLDHYYYVSPKDASGWLTDLRDANAKLSRAIVALQAMVR